MHLSEIEYNQNNLSFILNLFKIVALGLFQKLTFLKVWWNITKIHITLGLKILEYIPKLNNLNMNEVVIISSYSYYHELSFIIF